MACRSSYPGDKHGHAVHGTPDHAPSAAGTAQAPALAGNTSCLQPALGLQLDHAAYGLVQDMQRGVHGCYRSHSKLCIKLAELQSLSCVLPALAAAAWAQDDLPGSN